MSRTKDLSKNVVLVAIGNSGSKLLGLIMMPLYTRWLAPADFGVSDMIFVYVTMLINIVTFNISEAVFVLPHGVDIKKQKGYFSSGFIFLITCLFLTLIISVVIFLGFRDSFEDVFFKYSLFIGILLTTNALQNYVQQFTRSIHRMDVFSFTGLIHSVTVVLLSFMFIPSLGVEGYIICMTLGHLIAFLYALLASKSYNYIKINAFNNQYLKDMLQYSIPLIPNVMVWWLISSLNRPIMEKYVGLAGIGLFAVSNKFPSIVNMIFGFFQQAWIVTVLDEFKKPDFSMYYNKILNAVFLIQITLVFLMVYISTLLVRVFAAPEYYEAWVYVPILSLAVLFTNISAYTGTVFSATRQSKYYFYSSMIGAIVAIILNFLLIPSLQIWGAGLSILFAHFASAVSRCIYSSRIVKITHLSNYLIALLLFVIAYGCFVKMDNSFFSILIGLICYGTVLWINKGVISTIYSIVFCKIKK